MEITNFNAGPSILPKEVFQKASNAILDLNNSGLSILEISHRSKDFEEIIFSARDTISQLLNLSDEYSVLFLTGGASSQFFMVPMNLLNEKESAAYINTGTWAKNAIKEAKSYGDIKVIASSEQDNYNHIPKNYIIPEDIKYLHYTSNNTIFGTQFQEIPKTKAPLISDMSSDIFSREIDIKKYDLIYAGAQKNFGPAGLTVVILKKEILGKVERSIPTMLNYETHLKNDSLYNTPPVFSIYVAKLTLDWIIRNGGLKGMDSRNSQKAALLYDEIDRNSMFYGHAVKEDRSKMNVCFRLKDDGLEKEFLTICENEGLVGLKGHRSVGGFRASIYNAMEIEGVQKLVDVMKDFEEEKNK